MLASIVGGGGGGIGNIGAGAAIGTVAAATGMAAGMMMASATHAAGGASAIKAAFDAAHDTMSSGGGMSTGLGGSPSGGGSGLGGGGLGQAMGTGARFAANMGSNLAKGSMTVAKAGAGDRVSQTPGGKIASAIRANMEQPEFTGNRFANSTDTTVDREAETEAFVNSKR
jgi:hypothetical protein